MLKTNLFLKLIIICFLQCKYILSFYLLDTILDIFRTGFDKGETISGIYSDFGYIPLTNIDYQIEI